MNTKAKNISVLAMTWMFAVSSGFAESVINTKHNLSVTGPGTVKATTEREICIFCHTPHRAGPVSPLWNHKLSTAIYTPYSSSTLLAKDVDQPTGASKLCLSCHDGTVALGMVYSKATPIEMQSSVTTMPAGAGNLGTDLSADHPVSFVYSSDLAAKKGGLKDPSTLTGRVKLDHTGQLQCTSCHDPHDNQYGSFLVMDNTGSAICTTCHDQGGWSGSAHGVSTTKLPTGVHKGTALTSASVADNGCANCHVPHQAGTKQRLLAKSREDQTCYTCHGGQQSQIQNIQAEFNKISVHPVLTTQNLHDPAEDPINSPRHAACSDCHNTHFATGKSAPAPNAGGSILGTTGVNASGAVVSQITDEYELCFRCHADSVASGPARVSRQFAETNTRLQFNPANASTHPVEAIGKNPSVPSLIGPTWTTSSLIKCTDCHNNNQGPATGGTGPNGPHGSAYTPILERQLILTDNTTESAANYALCYKCHSRTSILANQGFKYHKKHLSDVKAACTTCHDPHGVANNTHLINFNTTYVTASSNGKLEFVDKGTLHGTCSLRCHGKDHKALSY